MEQIEREIKILNIDVEKLKKTLSEKEFVSKGKFIQDVYTFDLPSVDELYQKYLKSFIENKDSRGLKKLIKEIRPCFDENDLKIIKTNIGAEDLLAFIEDNNNDFIKLNSSDFIKLMKRINEKFSKWIRLRKTGDETTITIKRIVNSNGVYELDAVNELELNVPSIEEGKQLLEDLGYFFERHQEKMRIIYEYKNTEIVIDKWPRLKPYIEVEGPTKEEIEEVVLLLGYSLDDAIVINTDDVYREAGIDIYSKEYSDLSFDEKEIKEISEYMK